MTNTNFTIEFAARFKKSYSKKMGGTQTVIMPNGQSFDFNDKEYYSGRGAKFNSASMHDIIGNVVVTKEQVKNALKADKDKAKAIALRTKERQLTEKRIAKAAKQGVYTLKASEHGGSMVELSEDESQNQYFSIKRLCATLKISEEDAKLLNSKGKTYVFAKSEDGNIYELYHASLSCNNLNIWVSVATPERIAQFAPKEWQSQPFAAMLGQTQNLNHFVC